MRQHRALRVILGFALVGCAGEAAPSDEPAADAVSEPPRYETTRVADGVYRFRFIGHNTMFVVTDDGVIAFDPISVEAAGVLADEIRAHAPDMPLVIEENFTTVLAEKLKQGELDVIIISLPFSEQGILTLPLYDEPFVVLLPAAHPLTQRKSISSKQLGNEPVLLLGAGHCFRDQVLEACPACLPKPGLEGDLSNTVVGSSLETIRHMVVSGLGITILPCTATGADRYSQRLLAVRRFTRPFPTRTVALAWRISYPRPKVIDAISQSVAECGFTCVKPVRRKRV